MDSEVFLLVGAACAVVYLSGYCYRAAGVWKSVFKTVSVLALAVAAHTAGGPTVLLAALLLCALGDFLLSLDSEPAFMGGVGAFAAGHVAYIALILGHSDSQLGRLTTFPVVGIVIILVVLAAIMARVLAPRTGDLKVPVLIYIPIIVGMGISALTFAPASVVWLAIPGALLFVASDFVLSLEMFVFPVGHRARRMTPFFVWTTYWGAQALLMSAFTA